LANTIEKHKKYRDHLSAFVIPQQSQLGGKTRTKLNSFHLWSVKQLLGIQWRIQTRCLGGQSNWEAPKMSSLA